MKFPPWDPPEPPDEQILAVAHSTTRELYETGEMSRARRQELRDAMVADWKVLQKRRSNTVTTFSDTYTVDKQIGQGGSGFVYQVTNASRSQFALKLLDPRTATEERRRRFTNELGFCERNQHTNIITVVDRGIFENAPFYVMPLYSSSLRKLINESIEKQKVLPIYSQILDGV